MGYNITTRKKSFALLNKLLAKMLEALQNEYKKEWFLTSISQQKIKVLCLDLS
jgi:hypothetical protein